MLMMRPASKSGAAPSVLRANDSTVSLREASVVMDERGRVVDDGLPRLDSPRRFPIVSSPPRLPLMIPDEILDYYGWVFCQGGFLNLQMTFEQFLSVVAAVSPTGLCPEYDESEPVQTGE
ncbi:MAG TPA: hypothetical protein VGI29_05090 [Candidatus Binataceae bacterium]|jgi:hypothetical protein